MSSKNLTQYVVLDPKILEAMAYRLKSIRMDYYLFFEIVLKTGVTGLPLLKMTVAQIKEFCKKYESFLPEILVEDIYRHMDGKADSEYFFRAQRAPSCFLPKRTIENVIATVGEEFGYPNFTVKSINRTFYYEQLRAGNYSFEAFKKFVRSRGRFFATLEEFLEYCGLTEEEYKQDVLNHSKKATLLLEDCANCIAILEDIKERLSANNFSADEYRKISTLIPQVDAITKTFVK